MKNKNKYTLDTQLNPDAMYEVDSLVPVKSFRDLLEPFSWQGLRFVWNNVEYYIETSSDGGYTEVGINMETKALSKMYYFDTFEEALNANLIPNNPKGVIGDVIKEYERRCFEKLNNKK